MLHEVCVDAAFFKALMDLDEKIALLVSAEGCPFCNGPLHRSDYPRKPRGGLLASAGEEFLRRCSLCCGVRGCRKRCTPPSLRFLGRSVYLEVVVLLASVLRFVGNTFAEASRKSGVPVRTLHRWHAWWTSSFPTSSLWTSLRARFPSPPPDESLLPLSFLEHIPETHNAGRLVIAAHLLAPITTTSLPDSSRFLRNIIAMRASAEVDI